MKKITVLGIEQFTCISNFFTSCEAVKNANKTQRGAVIGALLVELIGGVLGNNLEKVEKVL